MTTYAQQRELEQRQATLDEMRRFHVRPSEVFLRRTRELVGKHAQSDHHRKGFEIKIQRALDTAA